MRRTATHVMVRASVLEKAFDEFFAPRAHETIVFQFRSQGAPAGKAVLHSERMLDVAKCGDVGGVRH